MDMDTWFDTLEKYNFWDNDFPDIGFVREAYTHKIAAYTGNRLVKVLMGQRRVGKSYVLRQLAMRLIEEGAPPANIFFVNCELTDFSFLRTYQDLSVLFKLYEKRLKPKGRIYLFIDEIQEVEGWERFVNSASQDYTADYEVFVSGSNSKMLSGELATVLSGRYVRFELLPFSFDEYCGMLAKPLSRSSMHAYMADSGLPELFHLSTPEIRRNYVSSLKDTVLLRDIIQRHKVKDISLLEDVFVFLINNASNLVSIQNIVRYFKSKGRKTSYDTVAAYIGYMEDTFLLHKAERYNIKGKDTMSGLAKYYINDLAFSNILYQGFAHGAGYLLENIIYLELRRLAFDVYVGAIGDKEVDFVAIKGSERVYVQCAYMLLDRATIEREYMSLSMVPDNYPKLLVSMDEFQLADKEGVKHVKAWDFANYMRALEQGKVSKRYEPIPLKMVNECIDEKMDLDEVRTYMSDAVNDAVSDAVNDAVIRRLLMVLMFVYLENGARLKDMMRVAAVSRATMQRDVALLKTHGFLVFSGVPKTGVYKLDGRFRGRLEAAAC